MIQPNHRPPASKQHNFNQIKAELPESNWKTCIYRYSLYSR
nr:MAG TPA_asm: hypothetical protein [Caudoviricetes sp.]DAW14212.1 MAG TPA: hypothetical protein [Caudoviricetes sp.]